MANEGGNSIIMSNMFLNLLLGGSLGSIWSVVNSLQICMTQTLFSLRWPAITLDLFKALMTLVSFGVIPVTDAV